MTDYAAAQQRLADAKRRRDTRATHAAILESRRLLTQALRERFRRKRGRLTEWWRRRVG